MSVVVAAPAATATAAQIPPVNCGIVSCTYPIDKKIDNVQECIENTKNAIRNFLQGTPQPGTCSL